MSARTATGSRFVSRYCNVTLMTQSTAFKTEWNIAVHRRQMGRTVDGGCHRGALACHRRTRRQNSARRARRCGRRPAPLRARRSTRPVASMSPQKRAVLGAAVKLMEERADELKFLLAAETGLAADDRRHDAVRRRDVGVPVPTRARRTSSPGATSAKVSTARPWCCASPSASSPPSPHGTCRSSSPPTSWVPRWSRAAPSW